MFNWIVSIIESLGLPGLGLLMLLENIIPPIPSELVIPLAGYLSAQGQFSPVLAFLAATTGATLGALFWYWAGRRLGRDRLRAFATRRGHWIGFTIDDLNAAEAWFERHGGKIVFLGRMVPGIRTFVSIPAGIAGMSITRFLLLTAAGSAIWTGLLMTGGYILEAKYELLATWIDPISTAVLGLVVLAWLWQIFRPRQKTRG